ncbi:MAG: hypothetical protein ACOYBY_03945 [Dermatophilaceae bacterium]
MTTSAGLSEKGRRQVRRIWHGIPASFPISATPREWPQDLPRFRPDAAPPGAGEHNHTGAGVTLAAVSLA